jgi:phenylalanine-4-hydroxylase
MTAEMLAPSHAGGESELVRLDADHPGFKDVVYRRRRNEIARKALEYREGDPLPDIEYTAEEQDVWQTVWQHLQPLHEQYACRAYVEASERVRLNRQVIPQLAHVNRVIEPLHGFRMLPVAGLVSARTFLSFLGRGIFLSTQYMRHHSAPLYTPEPDLVHELVGHAATFAQEGFTKVNRAFGEAVMRCEDQATVDRIGRVYWYTLEFGALKEDGRIKVYGAGLLSSAGELGRFEKEEPLANWDLDRIAETPYDPTRYQERFFVAPSFEAMVGDLLRWLEAQR